MVEEDQQEPTLYEKTEAIVTRQEKANEESRKILEEQKELHAKQMLGGHSKGGQEAPKEKTENEKWAEKAKERYAGSGMDPTDDDTPTTFG